MKYLITTMAFFVMVFSLTLLFLPVAASFAQVPSNNQVDVNRLVQNVDLAQSKISSLQSTVEMNAQNFVTNWTAADGRSLPPLPTHDMHIAAFKGGKYYSEKVMSKSDPVQVLHGRPFPVTRRNIFDGKQAYFNESPKSGAENLGPALWSPIAGRGTLPGMIDWMYNVGNKNIADIIRNRFYTSMTTSSSSEFGPLVGLDLDVKQVFDGDGEGTMHVDLAPAYGYAIVRQTSEGKQGNTDQKITKFTKVQGVYLPVEAENKEYTNYKDYSPDGRMIPFRFETFHFTNTHLNDVPDSLFVVKMKPGDIVEDNTSRYHVGANGEKVLEWGDDSTRSRKMLFGWLFMGSLATLLLLGIGFLVRYQRQSSAR